LLNGSSWNCEELLNFLAEKVGYAGPVPATAGDAFAGIIGSFAGPREATGRKAEDILYGKAA